MAGGETAVRRWVGALLRRWADRIERCVFVGLASWIDRSPGLAFLLALAAGFGWWAALR